MEAIKKISAGMFKAERAVTIVTFIAMMFIMFIQVIFRYVIHASLSWSEESMRFLFILTGYFGAACCTYEHKHVVIDFLGNIVRHVFKGDEIKQNKTYAVFDIIVAVVRFGFLGYIAIVMFRYAAGLQAQGAISSAMAMPMCWIGYAVAVAFACNSIHFFFEIFFSVDKLKRIGRKR